MARHHTSAWWPCEKKVEISFPNAVDDKIEREIPKLSQSQAFDVDSVFLTYHSRVSYNLNYSVSSNRSKPIHRKEKDGDWYIYLHVQCFAHEKS